MRSNEMPEVTLRFASGATRTLQIDPTRVVGLDAEGRVLVNDFALSEGGWLFGLTLCCNASDKGTETGIACRGCYGTEDVGAYYYASHYPDNYKGAIADPIAGQAAPAFTGEWEYLDWLECFEVAFTPVRYEKPLSMGVTPVVSEGTMHALVTRFQFLRAAGATELDFWGWDGNGVRVVQFDADPADDNHATWLLPDEDGNFDLTPLGYTFQQVSDDDRVIRTVR